MRVATALLAVVTGAAGNLLADPGATSLVSVLGDPKVTVSKVEWPSDAAPGTMSSPATPSTFDEGKCCGPSINR